MLEIRRDDLFDSNADAIVNTVNCVGVMGRGIALQFKQRYPENFKYYASACKKQEVIPGKMLVYDTGAMLAPRYIINFPTKRHWRGNSRLEDIANGLDDLIHVIQQYNISSIAIPPLGCGLGGLDWNIVKSLIEKKLANLENVTISLYAPGLEPHASNVSTLPRPNMTPGRAALLCLMQKYLDGMLDTSISLLEVHKLMYFMQLSGEKLRLNYTKAFYGPYADNLRQVLQKINGHFISGFVNNGDDPTMQLQVQSEAHKEAEAFLEDYPETRANIEHVVQLVEGFETSFGLELLATACWIVKNEKATSLNDVVQKFYSWNEHKKKFLPRQIGIALGRLVKYGWIPQIAGVEA